MRDSGAAIDNDSSATHVFNVQVAFNVNPVQFRVDSGDLTFSTNIYFKSNWMDVYGGAGKTLNLNGVLKRDGGDGGIAVKEDVIVNITNNNDASASDGISGAYWIERGVIRLAGSTNAPGASGIINIGTNASLQLNANQVWRPSRINIYGVGTNGVGGLRKYTSSGSMTWPGIVNFANTSAIGVDGGELILSGIVTGASQVTMVGSGTLILTNVNNAFTGMMIVSNGTVLAAVTGALGTVQTSTIGVDVKNGASLGLNALTYPNETLQITGLGVTNGGALIRAGTGATYPGQINVVAGSAGGARIQGGLTVSGIINLSNNTLYVRAPNTFTMASGSTISNATKNTGDGAIYKDGSSIFSLRPSSDLTGTVTIADGTLELAPNASGSGLVAGNFLILSNGVTVRSDGTAARTVNKITRIDGDVTLNGTGGNGGAVTYAGNVNLTGGTRILTATNATISGVISNGALSKAGAGILTLSGSSANVYTGLTTVTAGQLDLGKTAGVNAIPANISLGDSSGEDVVKLQANNQIADTSVLTLNGTAVNNRGVLRLNGYAETIGGLSGNGVVEHNIDDTGVGSSASTLTIDLSGSQTHDGVVRNTGASSTGTLAINKDGVGTQTFTGSNTYSGATAIRAGTLINLGSNTASAIGVGTSGFYYSIGHAGTLTVTGQISAGTASNTIGTLRAVAVNMQNSGRMQVNYLNSGNMNGAAGTDWDVITVDGGSGTYTVNAVDGSDFVIALKGTPTFNPALGYTNIIVDAGTASSFVANKFTVDVSEFNGGSLGGGTVTVDADSGNLRLIFAPGTAPDVVVLGNATAIPDGDTTPAYGDDTDYSDVLVAGGTLTKTFTITNSGTATLGIGNVYTNAGGNPTNFVVTAQPASSLAAGLTTTFQVLFNPSTSGVAFADFEFTNNVSSAKNPYTFRVQGTGTYVEVAVSGLGNNIADGDASPTSSDGTDFGSVALTSGTQPRTFVITNSGNRTLTISGGITTSGTHAANFQITTPPSATIAPSGSTSFVVTFDPSAVGTRTATINFSNDDDNFSDGLTESSFDFAVQGFGVAPSITTFPTSLNFSSVLGTAPATQVFSITNDGLGSMTWTLSTNVTWLSVSNVTGSAAAGAGQVHTAYVGVLAGQVAGTSNATITVTSPEATNSTKTITVQWTISAIPDPTAQSATADGREMVRLAWTKNASYNVMIVHNGTNAPSVPVNGTTYSLGHTFADGSRVIAFNSGLSELEHVVSPGSTNFYAFYSMNNSYYSPGVSAGATTLVYQAGEVVEQFGYTNAVGLQALGGGQGWTNSWTISVPRTNTDAVVDSVNFATFQSFWPAEYGNRLLLATTSTFTYAAFRGFPAVSTGSIYVAALYRREFNEGSDGKFSGISFMNGSTEICVRRRTRCGRQRRPVRRGCRRLAVDLGRQ
jgi:autotransporter-associated beta strand protein